MGQIINIASLKARLEVPVIVHDILAGADRMDDETCYAMHAAIGDMKPHEALLCIALSARTLLAYCDQTDPMIGSLRGECEFMIGRHGAYFERACANELDILEHLPAVAADLQTLHARMKALGFALGKKNALISIFCAIFSTQANAQKMAAEEFIELYESLPIMPASKQPRGFLQPGQHRT
ncbi:MAG: hypothetical protein ACT4OY_08425 [Alphaproteobacteria bacterium]